jgi:hypothetical protein
MQILLLGCSYAVPNYFGPPGDPAETHTEYLLKNLGHTVHNCSMNGGSNLKSLSRAKDYLAGQPIKHPAHRDQTLCWKDPEKIDLVIWFHTDPMRDFKETAVSDLTLTEKLETVCKVIYQSYSMFLNQLNAKTAVIGGCADLHPTFYQYMVPDFCLPSWQTMLLGVGCQGVKFPMGGIPDERDLPLIESALKVIESMEKSSQFPDNHHPGKFAHQALVDLLSDKFQL